MLVLLLALACAPADPPAVPEPVEMPTEQTQVPAPPAGTFAISLDALRAATHVGDRARIHWVEKDSPDRYIVWEIVATTEANLTAHTGLEGTPAMPSVITWEERQSFLRVPEGAIHTEETLELPFGAFPSARYDVDDADRPGLHHTYWYVDAIPGTWALSQATLDGEVVVRIEVVEWTSGEAS